MSSQLDPGQLIKLAGDEVNSAIRVNVVASVAANTVDIISGDGSFDKATVTAAKALKVDGSAVTQPVSAASLPLPTGAATSANQATEISSLSSIDTKTPALGQALAAASTPVVLTAAQITTLTPLTSVIANAGTNLNTSALALDSTVAKDASLTTLDTSVNTLLKPASTLAAVTTLGNITGTISLPTGASTSANQTNKAQYTRITDGTDDADVTAANALKVDGSAVTQPVSAASLPLPTGAATSANQATEISSLSSIDTKVPSNLTVTATRLLVDGSGVTQPVSGTVSATQSGSWSVSDLGFTSSEFVRNDYTVNVTTAAYVQLIASTAAAYQEIEIFDSSGQTLKIAFGAAASEVDKFLVFPGGNGRIKRNVPIGTRISIRAVSATASVGEISLNLYG